MAVLAIMLLLYVCGTIASHGEVLQPTRVSRGADPFEANMLVNTSAEDEELGRYLWNGVRSEKRFAKGFDGKVIRYNLQPKLSKRVQVGRLC